MPTIPRRGHTAYAGCLHGIGLRLAERSATLELGGDVVANIAPNIGLWASADWTIDIAGNEQERRRSAHPVVAAVWQ